MIGIWFGGVATEPNYCMIRYQPASDNLMRPTQKTRPVSHLCAEAYSIRKRHVNLAYCAVYNLTERRFVAPFEKFNPPCVHDLQEQEPEVAFEPSFVRCILAEVEPCARLSTVRSNIAMLAKVWEEHSGYRKIGLTRILSGWHRYGIFCRLSRVSTPSTSSFVSSSMKLTVTA